MLVITLSFLLALVLFYWRLKQSKLKQYNLPPGPPGIPIFGNFFQVLVNPHIKFSKWAYKYGHAYTLNVLGRPILIVNSAQTMRQVFGSMESTGRFKFEMLDKISEGCYGVFAAEGETWHELRIFTIKAMRECGIGRSSVIEPIILNESQRMLEWFQNEAKTNSSGVVVNIRETFIHSMSNFTWAIFNRDTSGLGKSEMGKVVMNLVKMWNVVFCSGLLFFPWIKYIAPEMSGYNGYIQSVSDVHKQVQKYFDERISERKKSQIDPANRNLLDCFLDQWENCTDPKSSFYGETGWKHCFHSMVLLLIAAGDTSAASLNWVINYLVSSPDAQQKLHEEINKNLPENKNPSLLDKAKFPYLEAVILETLRMSTVVPMGLMHTLLEDVSFGNYRLPKDTILLANIYHANNEKAIWGDPENFRPERFLEVNADEKCRLKEHITAFQLGKRQCPGESLAKDALYLLVAKLVQKFQFSPAPGRKPLEYVEPDIGFVLLPKQIGICLKERNAS